MSKINRANIISREFTGAKVIPKNTNRAYLFIVCTSGSIGVEYGEGGGVIPLSTGVFLEPYVIPTSSITISGTGTYTVAEA